MSRTGHHDNMATLGLVESSTDAFWNAAGPMLRPSPRDGPLRKGGHPLTRVPHAGVSTPRDGPSLALPPHVAEHRLEEWSEFIGVTVDIHGRAGYNSAAINGLWRFWKVQHGRLGFRRDADLQAAVDDGAVAQAAEEATAAGRLQAEGGTRTTLRLYLFYLPQADSWVISDASDGSGSIAADCGPVGACNDLGQHWRVWNGGGWREDRNVVAQVSLGGAAPSSLRGLRPALPAQSAARSRAHSQGSRMAACEIYGAGGGRAPESARRPRLPRPHDLK